MFMLRVTIMSLIFLCSKQGILTPGFTMDAEHVDKTYNNNPDVQPGPEPNKSDNEKPSWRDGESGDPGTGSTLLPNHLAPVQMTSQPLSLQIHCMYLYLCSVFYFMRVISYGYIYMYMIDS